jgi:hypothetical protein
LTALFRVVDEQRRVLIKFGEGALWVAGVLATYGLADQILGIGGGVMKLSAVCYGERDEAERRPQGDGEPPDKPGVADSVSPEALNRHLTSLLPSVRRSARKERDTSQNADWRPIGAGGLAAAYAERDNAGGWLRCHRTFFGLWTVLAVLPIGSLG